MYIITIYIILLTSYNIRRRRRQKHFGFRFPFMKMMKRLEKKTKPDLVKTKPGEFQNLNASLDHAALPLPCKFKNTS